MKAKHAATIHMMMRMRKITYQKLADAMGVHILTARKYANKPKKWLTPELSERLDKLFKLPNGTTHIIALGECEAEDLIGLMETIRKAEQEGGKQ